MTLNNIDWSEYHDKISEDIKKINNLSDPLVSSEVIQKINNLSDPLVSSEVIQKINNLSDPLITSEVIRKINNLSNPLITSEVIRKINNLSNPLITSEVIRKINNLSDPLITSEVIRKINNFTNPVFYAKNIKLPSKIVLPSLKFQTYKSIQNINLQSLFTQYNNLNIKEWREKLKGHNRDNLAHYLKFDVYLPLQLLDFIPTTQKIDNQVDANEYLEYLLEIMSNNGMTIFDSIPKNIFLKDVEKMKMLYDNEYYKILSLFCFERVEFIINELRKKYLNEVPTKQKGINISIVQALKEMKVTDNKELNLLINSILKLTNLNDNQKFELNLFKRFSEDEEIIQNLRVGLPPLNRNLLFHGHITDEMVDQIYAQKAILCFGFFATLLQY